ncbi:MAG: arginine--tRNA ligase, partial [Burkholderiaceae bacterium]|nr:arginine--tRNA ligase [Burkholderiaceae bacterium]
MLPQQQDQLSVLLLQAVAAVLPDAQPTILLERPKVAAHGDLACNVAMQLAKPAGRNPRELAEAIV